MQMNLTFSHTDMAINGFSTSQKPNDHLFIQCSDIQEKFIKMHLYVVSQLTASRIRYKNTTVFFRKTEPWGLHTRPNVLHSIQQTVLRSTVETRSIVLQRKASERKIHVLQHTTNTLF